MIFEETIILSRPFLDAVDDVKEALGAAGFGTLTEIDMRATLIEKINADIGPYIIFGACNPLLANRALDIDPQIGVLLPCNVVVRQPDENVIVEAMDPGLMASVSGVDDIAPIAAEARNLVNEALGKLASTAALGSGK